MKIALIVARSANHVIGKNNQIPWHLPADLRFFKQTTLLHTVVMGRKTFESIGRALPQRRNLVVSRNPDFQAPGCEVFPSLESALQQAEGDWVFIIGGATLYEKSLPFAQALFITEVDCTIAGGDTFFPFLPTAEWEKVMDESHLPDEKNEYPYRFTQWIRREG
jgi:dihydrofolate reductase